MANYLTDTLEFGDSDVFALTTPYATCATAQATTAKKVSYENFLVLETGAKITVKFSNASVANATLNVNNTGAKSIYYRGAAVTASTWKANDTITFVYDGMYWVVEGHVDTETASSDTSEKIYLIGAKSQSSSGQTTYSHDTAYVGTDGCLYSNNKKVLTEHPTINKSTDTTSRQTVEHNGTFTVVDSVTRDTNGHVLEVNTKTITLPNDTDIKTQFTEINNTSGNYPLLFHPVSGGSTTANKPAYDSTLYFNPSTDAITLPGILNICATTAPSTGNGITIKNCGNKDCALTFDFDGTGAANWRMAYLGSGSGDANKLAFQSTASANGSTTYSTALDLSMDKKTATFYGDVVVASGKTVKIGNTTITEAQLQKLLKFIDNIDIVEGNEGVNPPEPGTSNLNYAMYNNERLKYNNEELII